MQATEPGPNNLSQAIDELKSLQNGDRGLLKITAFGRSAEPRLRELLFAREPSGLYQVRCGAVEALKCLGAYDVLIEFLSLRRDIADQVERLGEDAVINAAARALASVRYERVFQLLLQLGRQSHLTGIISAIGAFRRLEAIPVLINALNDDGSRSVAESALNAIGSAAIPALANASVRRIASAERESESSLRWRRSALKVLSEVGISSIQWSNVRALMQDPDLKISFLACKLGLAYASRAERADAVRQLIRLLRKSDWMLGEEIEECLVANFEFASQILAEVIQQKLSRLSEMSGKSEIECLLRVQSRGKTQDQRKPKPESS